MQRRFHNGYLHYGDVVETTPDAPAIARPGSLASVCGVSEGPRSGFAAETIYLIEFSDGEAVEVHEAFLRAPTSN
jgi:hypothetical protein